MFYLLAAILCSACVSIVMRWSKEQVQQPTALLVVNYLTCTICALCFCTSFAMDGASFACGGIMGILLVAGLALLQYNIRIYGVIVSSLYTRLGVIVPILCSIVLFYETPVWTQCLGIFSALLSIFYLNHQKEQQAVGISLLVLLLANGTCDAMNKVFEAIGDPLYNGQFLLIAFGSAWLLTICWTLKRKEKITKKEIFFGLLIGVPNYFSSRFLLYSLQEVQAVIAYPTYSVLTIIVITIFGLWLWHEQMTKKTVLGMIGILFSILLMNV